MRLILRHLNVSTLLLLLDRRRCAGNPEEGRVAPDVLVERSADSPSLVFHPGRALSIALPFCVSRLISRTAISHYLVASESQLTYVSFIGGNMMDRDSSLDYLSNRIAS